MSDGLAYFKSRGHYRRLWPRPRARAHQAGNKASAHDGGLAVGQQTQSLVRGRVTQALGEGKGNKTMRKTYAVGLALVAVLAFSAAAVASASAAEWLLNGEPIEAGVLVPAVTTGLLFLTDLGSGVTVHCEGRFLGSVDAGGLDEITLAEPLTTEADLIECEVTKEDPFGICKVGVIADVEAVNLPWKTELKAVGAGVRDDIVNGGAGEPGYKVVCGGQTDTCLGHTSAKVTLNTSPVPSAFDAESEKAKCEGTLLSGEGDIEGEGTIESPNGVLEVS